MFEVDALSFSYGRESQRILDEISFSVRKNECVAVLGNNGAGKSTLLKCIDRIYPADEGMVRVDGQNLYDMSKRAMAQHIAYVPQTAATSGSMTVFDTVLLGRRPYITWDATTQDKEIAIDVIEKMGMSSFLLRNVSELSGGETQKVMLARALAQEPKILLLDEPTSNLDPCNQHEVLHLVRRIAKEHDTCVIIIIHDLNLAIRYCDKFLFLKDSGVYAFGGVETMTPEAIEQVYGICADIIEHKGMPVVVPYIG
ncbi:ABC transporter ATP-binding protein [Collinsella sp. AGMB00827]|uniref:ABC transporter ATP-binding protein n=1 Tax=Collinsella ureilytica TaxID=2869515 RepID=A0ABS7MIL2_9ACTN|nr:ABC transporter ATP-binding protein [Collinsella urealyticum]MBY4797194.1 ABC transporter ATP-binding protein [Collinsella urealyticum]